MDYRIQPDETLDQKLEKFAYWLSMLYPERKNGPREKHVAVVRAILECYAVPTERNLAAYLDQFHKADRHLLRRAWFDYAEHRADLGEYVAQMPD